MLSYECLFFFLLTTNLIEGEIVLFGPLINCSIGASDVSWKGQS